MKNQKQKQKMQSVDLDLATMLDIAKHKIEIWQQAEARAKQYLMEARKRRKQAEKELKELNQ